MDKLIDLEVSHHQIQIRSVPFNEGNVQWDERSLDQGVLINKGHIIFDPIVDGAFAAKVNLRNRQNFSKDENALRIIVVPLEIFSADEIFLASVISRHFIDIDLVVGRYSVYFEVCESSDVDEVYYNITFIHGGIEQASYLMDDDFGGTKDGAIFIAS